MNTMHRLSMLGCTLIGLQSSMALAASDSEPPDNELPVVLTPTRLRESLANVPASVTIITADMLRRFGITSVPEALRLVPGMAVTQATGSDYRIGYHGTNMLTPRRMNVLIDGVSVYRPGLARVDWKELPVAIDDIERIEVTRGPNSASYGANAMLAIVNILTRHPRDSAGTTLTGTAGSQRTSGGTLRHGGNLGASTSYRITLDHQEDGGFDVASTLGQGHDTTRLHRLNFRSVTELNSTHTLDLQATVLQGLKEIEFIDRYQQGFPDIGVQEVDVSARWQAHLSADHALQVQVYATRHSNAQAWRDCLPTITLLPQLATLWRVNPGYVNAVLAGRTPSGGTAQDNVLAASAIATYRALGPRAATPTCVDANQNVAEQRIDAELQDTLVLSDQLRVVSGFGLRRDVADSQTYLQGRVVNNSWRVFANAEVKPDPAVSINAGGFFERDQLTGSAFSPRLALNLHANESQTIRFVVSRAVRMPDILEQRADWRYRTTAFSPALNGATDGYFYPTALAPGNLTSEKILSREIGYLGNFPQYGLLLDAKVFDDRLRDLVSEKLQVFSFAPTNRNQVRLRGAEVQVNWEPDTRWKVFLSYAYLDNAASTLFEQTQYSRHSGALGVSRAFGNDWQAGLAWYGASANGTGQTFQGRTDLTLSKKVRLGDNRNLLASLTARHRDNTTSRYLIDVGQTKESRDDSAMQYVLTLNYSF